MKYEIGARLRYFREQRGLSQKNFAAQIGVSNSRVSNWEKGINRPDADRLAIICQVLQISADELLDISLSQDALTEEEKQLIFQYRRQPELHRAIRILLGIEKSGNAK
ncbi:MAG: helix-turn-helix transcriptional regulator [Clostridiales bacterium]|nr:helix-turn-helix transcriptional regulator [Clostridiales bacterium]